MRRRGLFQCPSPARLLQGTFGLAFLLGGLGLMGVYLPKAFIDDAKAGYRDTADNKGPEDLLIFFAGMIMTGLGAFTLGKAGSPAQLEESTLLIVPGGNTESANNLAP